MLGILRRYGTLIGIACVFVDFWIELPHTFLTSRNLLNITQQMSMLAVVAFTMTVAMAMGDFDLRVGAMASLAEGFVGGAINGILVSYVGILPFIATLGAMTALSGLAFRVSGGKTNFGSAIPPTFSNFARGGTAIWPTSLTSPNLTWVALGGLGLIYALLEHTVHGRRLYAIGGGAEAARLAGVRIGPLRKAAFALSELGAAVVGLIYASRVASANPTQGAWLMLDAIAAVFLGMTMSDEGQPRVLFTRAGVLILDVLGNGFTPLNVDSYVREMITGAIVIAAVAASSVGRSRQA